MQKGRAKYAQMDKGRVEIRKICIFPLGDVDPDQGFYQVSDPVTKSL